MMDLNHLIHYLFLELKAIFPAWQQAWPDQDALDRTKANWAKAFVIAKINAVEQIKMGLDRCRLEPIPFAPSPGQFIQWCSLPSTGSFFLSKEEAYDRAYAIMRNEDTSDLSQEQLTVLLHALKQSDSHFMKSNARSTTQPVFYRNYDIAIKQMLAGELKPIPKALPSTEQNEDPWKTLKYYGGVLPQYAHLTSRDRAIPVIRELLRKNGGKLHKEIPK